MRTLQLQSHIDTQGFLQLKLPSEWANQDVNVVVVLEKKAVQVQPQGLEAAFELLAAMPDDFMQDDRKACNEANAQGIFAVSTRACLKIAEEKRLLDSDAEIENALKKQRFFCRRIE